MTKKIVAATEPTQTVETIDQLDALQFEMLGTAAGAVRNMAPIVKDAVDAYNAATGEAKVAAGDNAFKKLGVQHAVSAKTAQLISGVKAFKAKRDDAAVKQANADKSAEVTALRDQLAAAQKSVKLLPGEKKLDAPIGSTPRVRKSRKAVATETPVA